MSDQVEVEQQAPEEPSVPEVIPEVDEVAAAESHYPPTGYVDHKE